MDKINWINGQAGGTPLSAENLNLMQDNIEDAIESIYPIGSIYLSTVSTNPNTLFGFGTWTQIAQGRTLVGVDTSDTDFDTVKETGGSKTQDLRAQIGAVNSNTGAIGYKSATPVTGSTYTSGVGTVGSTPGNITTVNHSTIVSQSNGKLATTVQPYYTCYIWLRTA